MARRPKGSVPALQHHVSGRARVRINGRDFWLGKWGTPEAQLAYDRLIAEYLTSGRIVPSEHQSPVTETPTAPDTGAVASSDHQPVATGLTVAEVAALYLEHCATYYRGDDGKRTSTYDNALQAVRAIRCFDDIAAASFELKKLTTIRDAS